MADTGRLTATYTATHVALKDVAAEHGVDPFAMRVAVAIHDRSGAATTYQLNGDLACDTSGVRRAVIALRARGLVLSVGVDGESRRRGVLGLHRLTPPGTRAATRVYEIAAGPQPEQAAAA